MAYDPDVPPSLITQGIGGPSGLRWFALTWIDPIADVLEPGYISNAAEIGLRPGDGLIYKDVNRGEWDHYDLICLEVDENGAATVAFPEVPEEALPFTSDIDVENGTAFAVMYYNGRQIRAPIETVASAIIAIPTQEEAEAGELNEKRMTPLRTRQAIDTSLGENVRSTLQFGCVHDAVHLTDLQWSGTDNSDALDEAFAWLAAEPGRSLYVPDGLIGTSKTHPLPDHSRIFGSGGIVTLLDSSAFVWSRCPIQAGYWHPVFVGRKASPGDAWTRKIDMYRCAAASSEDDTSVPLATPADAANFTVGEIYYFRSDESQEQFINSEYYDLPLVNELVRVTSVDAATGVVEFEGAIGSDTATAGWLCKIQDGAAEGGIDAFFCQGTTVDGLYIGGFNLHGASGAYNCHWKNIRGDVGYIAQVNGFKHCTFHGFDGTFTKSVWEIKFCASDFSISGIRAVCDKPSADTSTVGIFSIGERCKRGDISDFRVIAPTWSESRPIFQMQPGRDVHIHHGFAFFPSAPNIPVVWYADEHGDPITECSIDDVTIVHGSTIAVSLASGTDVAIKNKMRRNTIRTTNPSPSYSIQFNAGIQNDFSDNDFGGHLPPNFVLGSQGNAVWENTFSGTAAAQGAGKNANYTWANRNRNGNGMSAVPDLIEGSMFRATKPTPTPTTGKGVEIAFFDDTGSVSSYYGQIAVRDRDNAAYRALVLRGNDVVIHGADGAEIGRFDDAALAVLQTSLLIRVNNGSATQKRIILGAADSGGAGYRQLLVSN